MVRIEGNPVRDESGGLQMIVLLCSDLTARDDAETAGLRAILAAGGVAPNGGQS